MEASGRNSRYVEVLHWLLCATAGTIPFIAASQIFAYAAAALTLWLLIREPGMFAEIPRRHWIPVMIFTVMCLGSLGWGSEGARGLAKAHRLALVLLIPAVPVAFAGRPLFSLAGGLVIGSMLSALRDAIRIPMELAAGTKLLDTGSMTTPQFYLVGLIVLLAIPPKNGRLSFGGLPWVWMLGVLLSLAGLLIHFKRGVWLAFAASVILLAILRRNRKLWGVLAVVVIVLAALPATRARMGELSTIFSLKKGDRAAIWSKVAPPMLQEHPWGYGYKATRPEDLQRYYRGVQPHLNHLHNNALQMAVELGWLGGGFWTAWMLFLLAEGTRAAWKVRDRREGGGVAGMVVSLWGLSLNGLVENNFGDTEIFMLYLLLIGVVVRQSTQRE